MVRKLPFRILGESWWKEELPTEEEREEGIRNLASVGNKVDYIISHCASSRIQEMLYGRPGRLYKEDLLTDYFQMLEKKVQYKHWYFGHYHRNMKIDEKHTVVYEEIIPVGKKLGTYCDDEEEYW